MNKRLCLQTQEPHFVRDIGLLRGAVGRPYASFAGVSKYTRVNERATALTAGIAGSHPFEQGNKRTAWMMGLYFLQGYGADLEAVSATESESKLLALIDRKISDADYAAWLASHIIELHT